jgi:hypothetical protein
VQWLEELASQGLLKRLAAGNPVRGSELLAEIAMVVAALPVRAERLAGFAARLFGDAHALDAGTARATLAVRAATRLAAVSFEDDAEGRRSAWASVGIYLDDSALQPCLNLPANGDSALTRLLRTASLAGEPLHLCLRWLMRDPLDHDRALAHRTVFVCENPTIVALAARQLGRQCAPLVCVNGQPATPAKLLLRQLVTAGARLRYHGDLDGKRQGTQAPPLATTVVPRSGGRDAQRTPRRTRRSCGQLVARRSRRRSWQLKIAAVEERRHRRENEPPGRPVGRAEHAMVPVPAEVSDRCATQLNDLMQSYEGHDVSEVVATWRPPQQVIDLSTESWLRTHNSSAQAEPFSPRQPSTR